MFRASLRMQIQLDRLALLWLAHPVYLANELVKRRDRVEKGRPRSSGKELRFKSRPSIIQRDTVRRSCIRSSQSKGSDRPCTAYNRPLANSVAR